MNNNEYEYIKLKFIKKIRRGTSVETIRKRLSEIDDNLIEMIERDEEFLLKAIKEDKKYFSLSNSELRKDIRFIKLAILANSDIMKIIPEDKRKEIINDKQFVLSILKKEPYLYIDYRDTYVGENLKEDRDVIIILISYNPSYIEYAPEDLRQDKDFMLEAITKYKCSLKYAGKNLQNDKEVVTAAVNNIDPKNDLLDRELDFASYDLRYDKDFILELFKKCNTISLWNVEDIFKEDKEVVASAVEKDNSEIRYASIKLRNDYDFMIEMINKYNCSLSYASTELKSDYSFVLNAVQKNGLNLEYADSTLKNNINIVYSAIKQNPTSILYVESDALILISALFVKTGLDLLDKERNKEEKVLELK